MQAKKATRFKFGKNWLRFLSVLNQGRISGAEKSLKDMLEVDNLNGKSFLDIGSGSGLFSLAARRLGAIVFSFDCDSLCVACTKELKRRYYHDDENWKIEEGSVLDKTYLSRLGEYDIVYSWGVLHHTGNMWKALENVVPLVNEKGKLFISIYNDQGPLSKLWKSVKRRFNRSSRPMRVLMLLCVGAVVQTGAALIRILHGENPLPFKTWAEKKEDRGMSVWHDLVDWVGGYPFEVAKPEEVFDFYRQRGFELVRLITRGGSLGCNEFVFVRK